MGVSETEFPERIVRRCKNSLVFAVTGSTRVRNCSKRLLLGFRFGNKRFLLARKNSVLQGRHIRMTAPQTDCEYCSVSVRDSANFLAETRYQFAETGEQNHSGGLVLVCGGKGHSVGTDYLLSVGICHFLTETIHPCILMRQ